jgi:hypothetical protein
MTEDAANDEPDNEAQDLIEPAGNAIWQKLSRDDLLLALIGNGE